MNREPPDENTLSPFLAELAASMTDSPASVRRGLILSAVFPGLGEIYQGNVDRGSGWPPWPPCSRHFLAASKTIDSKFGELKYYNSKREERISTLTELSKTDAVIIAVVVDKWDYKADFHGKYKNELYECVFEKLVSYLDFYAPCRSINIMLDRTSAISLQKMNEKVKSLEKVKVNSCKKYDSFSNKCRRLADFVVGAIRENYENGNDTYYQIIKRMIHCP